MYTVVIRFQGDLARLPCDSLAEAQMVRTSFINWGGMGYDIEILK